MTSTDKSRKNILDCNGSLIIIPSVYIFISLEKGLISKNISEDLENYVSMCENGKFAFGYQHYENSTF